MRWLWWGVVALSVVALAGAIILAITNLRRIGNPNRIPTWTAH
jgi:hypothetical protein